MLLTDMPTDMCSTKGRIKKMLIHGCLVEPSLPPSLAVCACVRVRVRVSVCVCVRCA